MRGVAVTQQQRHQLDMMRKGSDTYVVGHLPHHEEEKKEHLPGVLSSRKDHGALKKSLSVSTSAKTARPEKTHRATEPTGPSGPPSHTKDAKTAQLENVQRVTRPTGPAGQTGPTGPPSNNNNNGVERRPHVQAPAGAAEEAEEKQGLQLRSDDQGAPPAKRFKTLNPNHAQVVREF